MPRLANHQVKPFYSGSKSRATMVTETDISIVVFCRPACLEGMVPRGRISEPESVAAVPLRSGSGSSLQNPKPQLWSLASLVCKREALPLSPAVTPKYCQETQGAAVLSKLCLRGASLATQLALEPSLCCPGCRPLSTNALVGHPVACHLASAWPEKVITPSRDKVHSAKNPEALEGEAPSTS